MTLEPAHDRNGGGFGVRHFVTTLCQTPALASGHDLGRRARRRGFVPVRGLAAEAGRAPAGGAGAAAHRHGDRRDPRRRRGAPRRHGRPDRLLPRVGARARGLRSAAGWRRCRRRPRRRSSCSRTGPSSIPRAVDRIVASWREDGGDAVAAAYGGIRLHPVLLARPAWPLVPDEGARALEARLVACDDLTPPGDVDVRR